MNIINIPTSGKISDIFESLTWQSFFNNIAQLFKVGDLTVSYTVATLPPGKEGYFAYATNGRKVGEGAGAGTGVPVYFSNGQWRVFSTDAQVAS